MIRRLLLVLPVLALTLSACGEDGAGGGWSRVAIGDLDETETDRLHRAKGAVMLLGQRLMGRLTDAMAEGGAISAIDVCKTEAPDLASVVGKDTGIRLGRTSHKLRNPENRPPAWAERLIAEMRKDPEAANQPLTFRGPDGALGVTIPIRLKEFCIACHGAEDQIEADLRAKLADSYPDDQATGFAPGDLRGVFWAEFPGD